MLGFCAGEFLICRLQLAWVLAPSTGSKTNFLVGQGGHDGSSFPSVVFVVVTFPGVAGSSCTQLSQGLPFLMASYKSQGFGI